jgi:ribosome biogenesis GTPase
MPGGGAVVDTAGVRTFYLPPMQVSDLASGFPEIASAAEKCRFRGCRHMGEAGCAVEGVVSPERLDSYRRLLEIV